MDHKIRNKYIIDIKSKIKHKNSKIKRFVIKKHTKNYIKVYKFFKNKKNVYEKFL